MTGQAIAAPPRNSRSSDISTLRRALWQQYGWRRRIDSSTSPGRWAAFGCWSPAIGRPVLFIHGTVGPGAWPSLVAGDAGDP